MTRIVDLSHRLTPGKQRFKLDIIQSSVEKYVPAYKVPEGEWYIMEDLEVCTHVGTHLEAPFHAIRDGKHVADVDIRRLIGTAAIVDFSDKKYNAPITKQELLNRGRHISRGDIVLIKTGLSKHYGTDRYKRPYLETDTIDWFIEREIKCLGVDCSGIENRSGDHQEINHKKLFTHDIPLIEDMNNIDKLREPKVFFMALPLPIEELDASPLRPLAVEPLEAGKQLANIFSGEKSEWVW
jgi:arylformamidase